MDTCRGAFISWESVSLPWIVEAEPTLITILTSYGHNLIAFEEKEAEVEEEEPVKYIHGCLPPPHRTNDFLQGRCIRTIQIL